MKQAIALLPYIPLRSEASEQSEMVSQILFGEAMDVMETSGSWCQVKLHTDSYEGWCDAKMLHVCSKKLPQVSSYILHRECNVKSNASELILSAGSVIRGLNKKRDAFVVEGQEFKLRKPISGTNFLGVEAAVQTLLELQGVPYLWGGRTVWGIDCSGLSQLFGRLTGIDMPRDASQQVALGEEVMFVQDVKAGDLAFFGKEEKITHVGVAISNDRILHASGVVRQDKLDQQGIFNLERKAYTHQLRVIKRVLF